MSSIPLEKKGHTRIETIDGLTKVWYHSTCIVEYDSNKIVLKNDGHQTYTTKLRLNQASKELGLGYYVFQQDFAWFVDYGNATYEFVDGMELDRKQKTVCGQKPVLGNMDN